MYNSDYIPLDQEIIDQAVNDRMKKRNEAKNVLRDESRSAGGNYDIMVFHDARKDYGKFRRIIKALEELRIFWCEVDGEILVSRHEVYDVLGMK